MDEFVRLLESYATNPGSLIITGDFNFHVDSKFDMTAGNFLTLLESFNLHQHVSNITHRAGHILNLLFYRSDETIVNSITVHDISFSDHLLIKANFQFKKPCFERKCVFSQNLKAVDIEIFKQDLQQSSLLCDSTVELSQLVHLYQSELTEILEKHAPLKSRAWLPFVLLLLGIMTRLNIRRELEKRRWRTTKLLSDRLKFTEQCRKVNQLLHLCRSEYYSKLICDNRFDQRKLFGILSELLHRSQKPLYPAHASVKELGLITLLTFLGINLISVHDDIILPELCSPSTVLEKLASVSYDKLRPVICSVAFKFCDLDPIPCFTRMYSCCWSCGFKDSKLIIGVCFHSTTTKDS